MTQKNVQASQSELLSIYQQIIILGLFSAIRAESQKLRATVGNVSSQAVTEIKQHWVATNTVSREAPCLQIFRLRNKQL